MSSFKLDDLEPTVEVEQFGGSDSEIHSHPAYGNIQVSNIRGGGKTLFGSDIGHESRIRISIGSATLRRNLSTDWIHRDKHLIEFEMSHAQWANFISSQGNGTGTPVTLTWLQGQGSIPGISNIRTKNETLREEIKKAAREKVNGSLVKARELSDAIARGAGKKELREVMSGLLHHLESFSGSVPFVVAMAEEALEKATADAKIEVESFIDTTARRFGYQTLGEMAQAISEKQKVNNEQIEQGR